MPQNSRIGHEGVVRKINAKSVDVIIYAQAACAGCHAKGACGMADSKEKLINVERPDFPINEGDQVIVYEGLANAMFSVLMAYVLPVVAIVSVLFVLVNMGMSELLSALTAIFAVSVYFFILYLMRERIGRKINFTLEKCDNL
ncbi:MAG: SoxR reducing system RseC family protein [Culturomica sp.]|jgi:sigma-E factor negative regulatory protein RseC|nr:SoxR reducing system RseC family protein [Culturomica sp.]